MLHDDDRSTKLKEVDDKQTAIKSFLNKATIKSSKVKKKIKTRQNTISNNKSISPDNRSEGSHTKKVTRKDRLGSPIKKGGKQKMIFRDRIKDEDNMSQELWDVVNISLNEKMKSIDKISLKKGNNDEIKELKVNNTVRDNTSHTKNKSDSSSKKNNDENCSCLCSVF